ncbi:hypothetical protein PHMEG_00024066 [Phytophthora megakarya]|uniref:Uncharacterized protein n=1 Tax=Phytophthora megakarya TaxID=4795 RepID=A0A225VEL4_9STRA|nr:hypothetical protein PHMEG_00024066 [Phytophthora megakarya]
MARTPDAYRVKVQMAEEVRAREEAQQKALSGVTSALLVDGTADVTENVDDDVDDNLGGNLDEVQGVSDDGAVAEILRKVRSIATKERSGRRQIEKMTIEFKFLDFNVFMHPGLIWKKSGPSTWRIVVKDPVKMERRNADMKAQVRYQGQSDSEIPLLPTAMEPDQRKFICTHVWSNRDRSTGKRTSHKFQTTECPFQMLGRVKKFPSEQYGVVMKRDLHPQPRRRRGHLQVVSRFRTVPNESPLIPGIEVLVDANAGVPSIYNYIRENSNHRVSTDDVRDLVTRCESEASLSDDDAGADLIVDLNLVSPLNVSSA